MPLTLLQFDGSDGKAIAIEHYDQYRSGDYSDCIQSSARNMQSLIRQFTEIPVDIEMYWHTSHQSLCLNHHDSPPSRCIVIVAAGISGHEWFSISYRMKVSDAPWPDSWVHMEPGNVTKALQALEIALRNCYKPDTA